MAKMCPFKLIAYALSKPQPGLTNECDEKDCALWFGACECCSLPAIANMIDNIAPK
jgi:hypothetical protein